MKIVVCTKSVPDSKIPPRFSDDDFRIDRTALITDDPDEYSIQMALRFKDSLGEDDTEIIAISMSPEEAARGIRHTLAKGADRAIHVTDDALAGADTRITARVLAEVVKLIGDVDVVFTGSGSSDGCTGTIPTQLAGYLNWAAVTGVCDISCNYEAVFCERTTDDGFDLVRANFPCVISVATGSEITSPPGGFKAIKASSTKPYEHLTLADLGLSELVGANALNQQVIEMIDAPARGAGEKFVDDGTSGEKVAALLERVLR